jgi:hypothetical protein
MKSNRILLALALAGLASPTLAEKCHICDFSDEPIVVKPAKATGGTATLAPIDARAGATKLGNERGLGTQRPPVPGPAPAMRR